MAFDLDIDLSDLHYDNMGSWPLPVKITTCAILAIFIFVAGYFIDTQHQSIDLKSYQRKETQLREQFETKQRQSASLEAYKLQLFEIRKSFGVLLHRLPSKTEIPGLLEDISKTGIAAGLEFELFDPLQEVKHDFYAELPIKIIVVGDYHQFGQFVSRIAGLSRIVTLHDFDIKQKDKAERGQAKPNKSGSFLSQQQLRMVLTAKIYRYIDINEVVRDAAKKKFKK